LKVAAKAVDPSDPRAQTRRVLFTGKDLLYREMARDAGVGKS